MMRTSVKALWERSRAVTPWPSIVVFGMATFEYVVFIDPRKLAFQFASVFLATLTYI